MTYRRCLNFTTFVKSKTTAGLDCSGAATGLFSCIMHRPHWTTTKDILVYVGNDVLIVHVFFRHSLGNANPHIKYINPSVSQVSSPPMVHRIERSRCDPSGTPKWHQMTIEETPKQRGFTQESFTVPLFWITPCRLIVAIFVAWECGESGFQCSIKEDQWSRVLKFWSQKYNQSIKTK